jgi:hypothetical protein
MAGSVGELGAALRHDSTAPSVSMWGAIGVSSLAGYGAMGFMLALICAYGATTAEVAKTFRKVVQVSYTLRLSCMGDCRPS